MKNENLSKMAMIALSAFSLNAKAENKEVKSKSMQCYGVNACKGQNSCKVSEEFTKFAKNQFPGKYDKSKASISCKGQSDCGAHGGHLAWIEKTEEECKASGGFLMEKKDGKITIKDYKKG